MPLYVEFEANDDKILQNLEVHKLGLNVFLPIDPPDREQRDRHKPASIFLELMVSGINYSPDGNKLGLSVRKIFSKNNSDRSNEQWAQWIDCSEMFLVPTTDPSADSGMLSVYEDCQTLYGYLANQRDTLLKSNSSNKRLYFNLDSQDWYPGEIIEIRLDNRRLTNGDVHLWTCSSGGGTTCERIASSSPVSADDRLAFWIYWSEPLPAGYFDQSKDLFEHPCLFSYSGVKRNLPDQGAEPDVPVHKLEIVITLPQGCRDESDHNPLPRDTSVTAKRVSDWAEKKEKVHDQAHIFKQWREQDPENRRFVFFIADSKMEKGLRGKDVETIVYDNRGDIQRQSDLTVASVVVAAAVTILFAEMPYFYNCWSLNRSCNFLPGWTWVALCVYLLIPVCGFLYIEYRVHGRRWIPIQQAAGQGFWKNWQSRKISYIYKAPFRRIMSTNWWPLRPRGIHRLIVLTIALVAVFEYLVFMEGGLHSACPTQDGSPKTSDSSLSIESSVVIRELQSPNTALTPVSVEPALPQSFSATGEAVRNPSHGSMAPAAPREGPELHVRKGAP